MQSSAAAQQSTPAAAQQSTPALATAVAASPPAELVKDSAPNANPQPSDKDPLDEVDDLFSFATEAAPAAKAAFQTSTTVQTGGDIVHPNPAAIAVVENTTATSSPPATTETSSVDMEILEAEAPASQSSGAIVLTAVPEQAQYHLPQNEPTKEQYLPHNKATGPALQDAVDTCLQAFIALAKRDPRAFSAATLAAHCALRAQGAFQTTRTSGAEVASLTARFGREFSALDFKRAPPTSTLASSTSTPKKPTYAAAVCSAPKQVTIAKRPAAPPRALPTPPPTMPAKQAPTVIMAPLDPLIPTPPPPAQASTPPAPNPATHPPPLDPSDEGFQVVGPRRKTGHAASQASQAPEPRAVKPEGAPFRQATASTSIQASGLKTTVLTLVTDRAQASKIDVRASSFTRRGNGYFGYAYDATNPSIRYTIASVGVVRDSGRTTGYVYLLHTADWKRSFTLDSPLLTTLNSTSTRFVQVPSQLSAGVARS